MGRRRLHCGGMKTSNVAVAQPQLTFGLKLQCGSRFGCAPPAADEKLGVRGIRAARTQIRRRRNKPTQRAERPKVRREVSKRNALAPVVVVVVVVTVAITLMSAIPPTARAKAECKLPAQQRQLVTITSGGAPTSATNTTTTSPAEESGNSQIDSLARRQQPDRTGELFGPQRSFHGHRFNFEHRPPSKQPENLQRSPLDGRHDDGRLSGRPQLSAVAAGPRASATFDHETRYLAAAVPELVPVPGILRQRQRNSPPTSQSSGSGGGGGGDTSAPLPAREHENEELIDLLAQFYVQSRLAHERFLLAKSAPIKEKKITGKGGEEEEEEEEARMKVEFGADDKSLMEWLRRTQLRYTSLQNATFELLQEHPNRSIIVCEQGPKILVLPDKRDVLYCYTSQQWMTKLWSDIENSLTLIHCALCLLNMLIFLFGTTGNIFVCLSVYRNHQLRNVTNYFIVNLAFADLLVILICLPATVVWDLSLTWFFGTIACKLIMFLQVSFHHHFCSAHRRTNFNCWPRRSAAVET